MKPKYKRVLLKLSGEALLGNRQYGIDPKVVLKIAKQIKEIDKLGVQVAVIIGGGNIFRGYTAAASGMDRATADYMGMLATVMNALALQDAIESEGIPSRVQSAISMPEVAESYIRRRAIRHLEKKRVVIFAAGTGNPYFSTDTAASLRALEIDCEIILKATKVDGVYDKDPILYKKAKKIDKLTHIQVLNNNLKVIDSTAISLCMDNNLPIIIFNLLKDGNIKKAIYGEKIGTIIIPSQTKLKLDRNK